MTALRRELGLGGAILLGLGSILGTGVFVSIGIAAGVAGPGVVLATALAAALATANGLSSAALAAAHPVSGGTYAYGTRYLSPAWGFTAGWLFLCAKTASAATAARGVALYLGASGLTATAAAVGLVLALTALTAGGLRRSNATNAVLVAVTAGSLLALLVVGAPAATVGHPGTEGLGHATALMFVAYTGYGRIATLGEEVRDPARTIPRAIIATLVISMLLYVAVAATAVGAIGADGLAAATRSGAPLQAVARALDAPALVPLLAVGALTAMVGVVLNLLLGLSRVALAMGRAGDLPAALGVVHAGRATPVAATWAVGLAIAGLALLGDLRTTWSFSAVTVLLYYGITHLAALRLPPADRRWPRVIPLLGLVACAGLAAFIEPVYGAIALILLAFGHAGRALLRR